METFDFKLTTESSGEIDHKVNETSFGDGYVQATSIGINNKTATWSITAIGKARYIRPIMDFIDRHQGSKSFYWTPAEGEQGRYRTSKYKIQNSGSDVYRVSATFTQSYGVDTKAPEGVNVLSVNGETPDEYGNVTLNPSDIGAEQEGAATNAIASLKKEKNPFSQYALKENIPDVSQINQQLININKSITEIDTDVTNLQTGLADTNEYANEIHNEVETLAESLHTTTDKVNANNAATGTLQTRVSTNETAITNINSSMVKSVNGNKPDQKGNVTIMVESGGAEIDDEKPSTSKVYSSSKVKTLINAKPDIDDENVLPNKVYSSQRTTKLIVQQGLPLFSVTWWPSRNNVPAGYILADGQELSSSTYPEAAEAIAQNTVPTVSNAVWLSNPTTRGCYVAVSSDGMFRVPDYNGMLPDSLGALFLRGDNGEVDNGHIQLDALQGHKHDMITGGTAYSGISTSIYGGGSTVAGVANGGSNYTGPANLTANLYTHDDYNELKVANETRPLNVSGCFIVKLFGAVTNVGSANAAQLASDYANLAGRVSTLESWRNQQRFTFIYPNGGTAEQPANVTLNNRFVMDNPFPNQPVITIAEIRWGEVWGECGWFYSNGGYGIKATHMIETDQIIVQTGGIAVGWQMSNASGTPFGTTTPAVIQNVPCRIKVWRN